MSEEKKKQAPTFLEYLEFMSRKEFQKFRDMSPITAQDIRAVDWDKLLMRLYLGE